MARDSLDIQRSSAPLLERTESQRRSLCTPSPSHTKYRAVRTPSSVVPLPDRNAHGNKVHPFVAEILVCRNRPISFRKSCESQQFSRADWLFPAHQDFLYEGTNIRESTRVNVGLTFTGGSETPDIPTIPHHALAKLTLPETTPAEAPTIEELIPRLIHPPTHAYLYNIPSLAWVRSVLGDHLESSIRTLVQGRSAHRLVGIQGRSLGIPTLLLDWLCGDDEAIGSSEQNILQTPDVFGG